MKFKKKATEDDLLNIGMINLTLSWLIGCALTMLTLNPIFIVVLTISGAVLLMLSWSIDALKATYLEDSR